MHTSSPQARPALINSPFINSLEVQAWQKAKIAPVAPTARTHSIHSYFNTCPESPDGRHVVYFVSTADNGELGDIRILERATGVERTLVSGITTEDAHRVACQQWVADGQAVAYHDYRNGRWIVAAVDLASGEERILAEDRQIGFGAACSPWIPIYGCHWKQGAHRGFERVHALTGELQEVLPVKAVITAYEPEIRRLVGPGDVSIFFPVVSPDANRAMFKIARGNGSGDFRSAAASVREGKFVYDIRAGKLIRQYDQWGHPSWSPDSSGIFEKGNRLYPLDAAEPVDIAPDSPSDHPTIAPHGRLFVTDAHLGYKEGGRMGEWGVVVGSITTGEFSAIHRFMNVDGARSWRTPHPHPVFSADGRRIYFNISHGGYTRIHVASLD